jgi:WD40 repeat protein
MSRTVGEYGDSVLCLAFSPDGRTLAYAGGSSDTWVRSLETTVRVVNLETGEQRALTGHTDCVRGVAFSPDGNHLATASWDMTARLANVRTDSELHTIFKGPGRGFLLAVAWSPNGRFCAVTGYAVGPQIAQAGVHVIDLQSSNAVRTFEGHGMPSRGLAFSPDSTRIATASWDGTVKIWLATPIPEFLSLEGHAQAVWTAAVSPNGQFVATGSLDPGMRRRGSGTRPPAKPCSHRSQGTGTASARWR